MTGNWNIKKNCKVVMYVFAHSCIWTLVHLCMYIHAYLSIGENSLYGLPFETMSTFAWTAGTSLLSLLNKTVF